MDSLLTVFFPRLKIRRVGVHLIGSVLAMMLLMKSWKKLVAQLEMDPDILMDEAPPVVHKLYRGAKAILRRSA